MPGPLRAELQQAYDEAVRTSSRLSFFGALGFGVALLMGVLLVTRGGSILTPFPLETLLLAGGLAGGFAFTVLAVRASRMASACRRRLDGHQK